MKRKETFVVDASVAIKLFVREEGSAEAHAFFERLTLPDPPEFWVPDLFFVECANIFWKYTRRFGMPIQVAIASFDRLHALAFDSYPTGDLSVEALQCAVHYGITTYDASYLVLAVKLSCPLVTADRAQADKLASAPIALHILL